MGKINSKNSVRTPNPFFYAILKVGSWFMSTFFFKLKVIKNEAKRAKGPYVIIQNHESYIDFYPTFKALNKTSHIVMSNSFYQTSSIRSAMKKCGVIPKQQFQTSITDLKRMKSALEAKRPLVFFPQGLMSEDGISTNVPVATGKALKWFKQDVYLAHIKGTYLTSPKWSTVKRKGKTTLEITKLFSKEDLEKLEQEEIEKIVEEKLYFDAYKNQEKDLIEYKNGDLIEGLHFPLYKCPKCGKEFTMNTSLNRIYCASCGNEGYADKYGFLHPKTENDVIYKLPSDWSRFIQTELEKEIRENDDFTLTDEVKVEKLDYDLHKFTTFGHCKVSMLKDKVILTLLEHDNETKEFDTRLIYLFPYASGKYFELQDGLDIYRVHLSNPNEISKWMNTLKVRYRIRNDIKIK